VAGYPATQRFLSKTDGVKKNHLISIIDKEKFFGAGNRSPTRGENHRWKVKQKEA